MDVYQRRRLVALSVLAALFVIFVLLIRSCGGDDEETPITPVSGATGLGGVTSLSPEDFAQQGDAICLQTNTLLASAGEDPASGEQAEIVAGELEQLQILPPPTDNTDQLDKFLGALQEQVAAYGERQTAAERGDDASLVDIDAALGEAESAAAKAARKFGFEICGDRSEVSESGAGGETGATATETDTATDTVAPVEPVTPAPTETAPAPAPTDTDGGTSLAPAPAPADDSSGSGGIAP